MARTMICTKALIKMARKWQNIASLGRKKISIPRFNDNRNANSCKESSVASKGHFAVYSSDQKRFAVPLAYLNNVIFQEEEFALPSEGPIRMTCDTVSMEYMITLIQRGLAHEELQKALINSLVSSCCSSYASFHA